MELSFEQKNYNTVESRSQLLEIVLKLCESRAVAAICSFAFWMDDIALISSSTKDLCYIQSEGLSEKYELRTDIDAIKSKLAGLYVLKEEFHYIIFF
ncbi:MAG: hypothetical protein HWN80_03605 [Candidatus Lokiarchaeota archaeon]|nr:hypothetical protein [Candidatus Lokiarchaeota archaeon]